MWGHRWLRVWVGNNHAGLGLFAGYDDLASLRNSDPASNLHMGVSKNPGPNIGLINTRALIIEPETGPLIYGDSQIATPKRLGIIRVSRKQPTPACGGPLGRPTCGILTPVGKDTTNPVSARTYSPTPLVRNMVPNTCIYVYTHCLTMDINRRTKT